MKNKILVTGHIKHYRPSEVFKMEFPDKYYFEIFEFNIKNTDILIDKIREVNLEGE